MRDFTFGQSDNKENQDPNLQKSVKIAKIHSKKIHKVKIIKLSKHDNTQYKIDVTDENIQITTENLDYQPMYIMPVYQMTLGIANLSLSGLDPDHTEV